MTNPIEPKDTKEPIATEDAESPQPEENAEAPKPAPAPQHAPDGQINDL